MEKINLKDFYPFYKDDCIIEVPQKVAEQMHAFKREEQSTIRKMRRYRANYSLNSSSSIEGHILFVTDSPAEIYEQKKHRKELYAAISSLPDKQAKRIYAHFLLGMSFTEIASTEGVSWQAIEHSISRGLESLEKNLKKMLKKG